MTPNPRMHTLAAEIEYWTTITVGNAASDGA
jgi:hypothetical protein